MSEWEEELEKAEKNETEEKRVTGYEVLHNFQ